MGEQIIWTGRPKTVTVPLALKVAAAVGVTMAIVALAFAVVVANGLHQSPTSLLFFSAWCASVALGAWRLPAWFAASVRYVVTDRRVIWTRGRLTRSIDRAAVSYAIIRWNSSKPGVGDLVLERAVPIGALRRTLSLTLANVEAPDRLWAIVRGLEPGAPLGDGTRPLAQRLDAGERVLWTSPSSASRWTARRALTVAGATVIAFAAAKTLASAAPPVARVLRQHALPAVTAAVLVAGVALVVVLLAVVASWVGYSAIWRPVRLARSTRYFVTDRRVLIRRGTEELHLDRERIAYVITAPRSDDRRDLFLVLDGPQARAFAPSGAFGGADDERLVPMFAAIDDADGASAVLSVSRISITAEPRQAA